ncbi:MAG: DUF4411 family protein [Chitinophagaceae bacterium]
MAILKPPYQYVIDTSALIDLKDQYPVKVFPGVWERFNEMCADEKIIAPREVLREIKKGDDDLTLWASDYEHIFLEPCEEEFEILQKVLASYTNKAIEKYSTGLWADPLVISCAKHYGLPIIQQESNDAKQFKIPSVANIHAVSCIRLIKFFEEESWSFTSQ